MANGETGYKQYQLDLCDKRGSNSGFLVPLYSTAGVSHEIGCFISYFDIRGMVLPKLSKLSISRFHWAANIAI